ncbi:hypothetical protein [Nitrospira sp. M1]
MIPEQELIQYEQDLVQALLDQRHRRQTEPPGSLQVFIGGRSLGTLDCGDQAKTERTFDVGSISDFIDLRSASGLLIGTLSVESYKPATAEFLAGNYRIELHVTPKEEATVLRLTSTNLLATPPQVVEMPQRAHSSHILTHHSTPWSMVALAAQVLLAAGVVFLVADRFASMRNTSSDPSLRVSGQEQQLEQVLQQLTALETRLGGNSVVAVKNTSGDVRQGDLGVPVVNRQEQNTLASDSVLEEKAESFDTGLLAKRPVWVRFKEGVADARRNNFFKEVSAKEYTQVGGWYSFDLDLPTLQQPDEVLGAFSKSDDIEIITTSVVTRRVQVRFKQDSDDNDINEFFKEIRTQKSAPNDNWYDLTLSLPEPVQPESFINELRSRNIVEQVKVDLDELPSL